MNRKRLSSRLYSQHSEYDCLNQSGDGENIEMQSLYRQLPDHSVPSNQETEVVSVRPRRIGNGVWFAIITSFLVLNTAIVFLAWFWFEDRGAKTWRQLILSGRATQSITLTGVLIRWAIGTLAAITTSMAASIAIERHGVPQSALAELSIARFTNKGPQSFNQFLPGVTFQPWLRVVLVCLLVFALASQFASTLLVADLGEFKAISFRKNASYGVGFMFFQPKPDSFKPPLPLKVGEYDFWSGNPTQSEIFAEYSEPGKSAEGIDDTGPTLRAFLPIASQAERESIQSFQGMAQIFDTRVICTRPRFSAGYCRDPDNKDKWSICANITADLSDFPLYYLKGDRDQRFQSGEKQKQFKTSFVCPIPQFYDGGSTMHDWLLCNRPTSDTTVGFASPLTNITATKAWSVMQHTPQLLMNFPLSPTYTFYLDKLGAVTWMRLNSSTSGPWVRQWSRVVWRDGSTRDEYVQMTLCFGGKVVTQTEHLNITASTISNHTEPTSPFDSKTNLYDTRRVRRQLGAMSVREKGKSKKREILTISKKDLKESLKHIIRNEPGDTTDGEYLRSSWMNGDFSSNVAICSSCINNNHPFKQASALLWQIFDDTLNETNSPALAVQTLNTIVLRKAYYEHITSYPREADSTSITTFELVQAPKQKRGFITLMVIIAGNILVFFIVAFFFLSATDSSLIGNAWHTVAQISQSDETQEILERARTAPDKDIDEWLRGEEPREGFMANVKGVFGDIKRIFSQREEKRLFVRDGAFTVASPR